MEAGGYEGREEHQEPQLQGEEQQSVHLRDRRQRRHGGSGEEDGEEG